MKLETKLEQVVKELNRRFGSTTTTEITVNNGETDTTYQAKYFTYFRKVVETTTYTYYGNTSSKEERTVGKRSYGLAIAGENSLKDLTDVLELPSSFPASAISMRQERVRSSLCMVKNRLLSAFHEGRKKARQKGNNTGRSEKSSTFA